MAEGDPPPTAAYQEVVDKLGTTAAPLLGGFSLTLIGLLINKDVHSVVRWPDLTLAALTAATALFLFTIQFTIEGRQYLLTREEHAERTPRLADDQRERAYRRNVGKFRTWATRARFTFTVGLGALLSGLIGVLLPPGKVSHFGTARSLALIFAAAALLWELVHLSRDEWVARQWNKTVRRTRSSPAEGSAAPPPAEKTTAA